MIPREKWYVVNSIIMNNYSDRETGGFVYMGALHHVDAPKDNSGNNASFKYYNNTIIENYNNSAIMDLGDFGDGHIHQ